MQATAPLRTRTRYNTLTLVIAVTTGFVFAFRRGQDANWDQLNYHLNMPFLLLHGTLWDSIAPSGIQTYLNPLVLVPQYLIIRALPPLLAVAIIASMQALAFVIAGQICLRIAPPDLVTRDYRPAFMGFLLCLASPMALSEAGTTIADLLLAVPVLLAYFLLLASKQNPALRRANLTAGALLGLAAGLKLTNAVYVIGAPAFFLTGDGPIRQRIGELAKVASGVAIGFLAVAGYWHAIMWYRFGNPVFPFANNVFHSPDAPQVALRDARFLPTSAWDILRYPMYWLLGGSPTPDLPSPASETDPKDARFILALALVPVALVVGLLRRNRLAAQVQTGLLLACAIDYVAWLFAFGIQRYLIPAEILCGAVLLALVSRIDAGRWRLLLLLGLIVIALARVHVASWGRLPWGEHWRTIARTPLALPGRPLIFLTSRPTAFLALSLPDNARYVGFDTGMDLSADMNTTLTRQLRTELAATPPFSLYAIVQGPLGKTAASMLASYGLHVTPRCRTLAVAAETFLVCDVVP